MTRQARLTLLFGLILAAAIITTLLVYRDHRDNYVQAANTTLNSTDYSVGIDYSGVLIQQNVKKGQFVKKGQLLGLVKSGTLIDRLHVANLSNEDLPYQLNENREVELRASSDGTIQDIKYNSGSFVPANQQIYEIADATGYYMSVEFERLSRPQIKILNADNTVRLTYNDGSTMPATIRGISIKQVGNNYDVELEVIPASQPDPAKVKVGEPLEATLILHERDTYTRVHDRITDILNR